MSTNTRSAITGRLTYAGEVLGVTIGFAAVSYLFLVIAALGLEGAVWYGHLSADLAYSIAWVLRSAWAAFVVVFMLVYGYSGDFRARVKNSVVGA